MVSCYGAVPSAGREGPAGVALLEGPRRGIVEIDDCASHGCYGDGQTQTDPEERTLGDRNTARDVADFRRMVKAGRDDEVARFGRNGDRLFRSLPCATHALGGRRG